MGMARGKFTKLGGVWTVLAHETVQWLRFCPVGSWCVLQVEENGLAGCLAFERYGGSSYYKGSGIGWLLLGTTDVPRKENGRLKTLNHGLGVNCESQRAFLTADLSRSNLQEQQNCGEVSILSQGRPDRRGRA